MHSVTDRRTDRQRDDSIMPIVDHTARTVRSANNESPHKTPNLHSSPASDLSYAETSSGSHSLAERVSHVARQAVIKRWTLCSCLPGDVT